jgi:outer membrane murein-binding lipoprotein Lpp
MKGKTWLLLAVVLVGTYALPAYAGGPSKEMVELQTQVQTLVQMQQKINEEMGVLRDKMNALVQQTTENLNKVTVSVDKLDKSMQQQQAASDSCIDQFAAQAQPLHNELTELRGRVDAVIKQLNEMNGFRQGTPGAPASGSSSPSSNTTTAASPGNPR